MKSRRHFAILDILSSERIATQEELGEALKQRGYNVTQATVSRDMKELCLIKIPDDNGYYYAAPDTHGQRSSRNERMKRIFQDSVVNYDYSENIIVLKTLTGAAQSIGSLIDAIESPYILGSVAGDDTIFVLVKPKEAVNEVLNIFKEWLSE